MSAEGGKKQEETADSLHDGSNDDDDDGEDEDEDDDEDDMPLALLVGATSNVGDTGSGSPAATPGNTPLSVLDLLRPMTSSRTRSFRLDTNVVRDWPFFRDEDGFQDFLDLENHDYFAVGTNVLEMACGGDWQAPMMVRIESDGTSLFVKESYRSEINDDDDENEDDDLPLPPWPAWINNRYTLNDEDIYHVVTGQYDKLDMDTVELTTEPTVLCRGSIPTNLQFISRNVCPPGTR